MIWHNYRDKISFSLTASILSALEINLFVSFISLIVATIYLIFFSDIDISIIIPGVLFLVVLLIMAILLKVKSK